MLRSRRLFAKLNVGDTVEGTVKGYVTDFGAFVDLGGVDGLLHIWECHGEELIIQRSIHVRNAEDLLVKNVLIQDCAQPEIPRTNPWVNATKIYNRNDDLQEKFTYDRLWCIVELAPELAHFFMYPDFKIC